jgi:predicted MFS family arabinose efflux permease
MVLFAGIVTRPTGGALAGGTRRRLAVGVALVGVAGGAAVLAFAGPYGVSLAGALVLGLCAGIPFAIVFAAAQRLRPDAPGAAVALVNGIAIATILLGTPLAGLAFELPGDGRVAFLAIACAAAGALLALRKAAL